MQNLFYFQYKHSYLVSFFCKFCNRFIETTYHDSLKRDRYDNPSRPYRTPDRYLGDGRVRKSDSVIENDFRRISGGNVKTQNHESEDEGFASSLLISSERQQAEDCMGKKIKEYDSDKDVHMKSKRERNEYVPRERSIDDGSHFDPRIDRIDTHKKQDVNKPPKTEKRSGLERVSIVAGRNL